MSYGERIKRALWNCIYPFFPYFERIFLFAHKKRRQPFHLGWLAPGKTLEELKHHLAGSHQFGNHFVAWEDQDQVLSWRKLDGFEYQYHVRIFNDGEIRGHYERTPEAAPIAHFLEKGETARTRNFHTFLGPYLTTFRYVQRPLLTNIRNTSEEITFTGVQGK